MKAMPGEIEYDGLNALLERCGSSWNAAQAHGLLTARVTVSEGDLAGRAIPQLLDGADTGSALALECSRMLQQLEAQTHADLAARLSEFVPLLPDDDDGMALRAGMLGQWCEAYLHGLVSAGDDEELRRRLAAEPLAEIIADLLQITRAMSYDDGTSDDQESDTTELAYAELVGYVEVVAQLVFEELADYRDAAMGRDESSDASDTLH